MIGEIAAFLYMLQIVAGGAFLVSLVFAIKLYLETDRGWYWLCLVLSAFFFLLSQLSSQIFPLTIQQFAFLAFVQESSKIVAGFFFAVSAYGIYKTMKKIREKVE